VTTPKEQSNNWMVATAIFAACGLFFAMVAVGLASRAVSRSDNTKVAASDAPEVAHVGLSEFKIDPGTVTVAQGGTLHVENDGNVPHNLTIQGTDKKTADIKAGDSVELSVAGLSAGTYTIFCAIPGHKQSGMQGTLKIETVAGGAAAASSDASMSSSSSAQTMTADQMDAAMAARTKRFPEATAGVGGQLLPPKILPDGTKEFDLTAKVVKWEVEKGKFVDAMTYNGTVPGPTLKVNPGDKVKVVVHNELKQSTSVHFHGLKTPNSMDGVPDITQEPIKPGQTFVYSWTAQDTPAVGMYHSHQNAVEQVPDGLAGAFLIGQEPVPAGVHVSQELPFMLNDSGTLGFTINGKSFPATAPVVANLGDWVEVHYMNEGTMIHPMHLHGLTQTIIAKDGYPVPQPYDADTVDVGPGERYTVLIHADVTGTWAWHCHILPHAEATTGMFGMVTAMVVK
jgi:FtsP/CotA-like multicopper oxidase with cupredoxin domain